MKSVNVQISDEEMAGVEKRAAEADVSPADFIADTVRRVLKARDEWERWERRAGEANSDEFYRILNKVPAARPIPGDELPED